MVERRRGCRIPGKGGTAADASTYCYATSANVVVCG